MLQLRKDAEIFRADGGRFAARWHFSFDRYRDQENMGFEGLTCVVEGACRREHDQGNDGILPPGWVQRMRV